MADKKWYIVHTYSGFEAKVKLALEQRIHDLGLERLFGEVLVPQQQIKASKKDAAAGKITTQKLFPGYVLVEMAITNESWHLINDTPKVTGFVGASKKPRPVPASQVEALKKRLESDVPPERVDVTLEKGQSVRITAGPFVNFVGVVDDARADRQKVRVLVSIFGRSTPIDLNFNQVETVK